MATDPSIILGLDTGGTGTDLVYGPAGSVPRSASGGGANLQLEVPESIADRLVSLVHRTLRRSGSDRVGALCLGIAGAGRDERRSRLLRSLAERLDLPVDRLIVIEDDRLALRAAFSSGSGIVVMAGTGSVVRGVDRSGRQTRSGGWGPQLGDEGGGYDLGRAGARAVARALDGGPGTELVQAFRVEWEVEGRSDLIRLVHEREVSLARLAPTVLGAAGAGDEVARRVVRGRIERLLDQVGWLTGREDWGPCRSRIVLGGGLADDATYRTLFEEAAARRLEGWSVRTLDRTPARAAWERARELVG